MSSAPKKLTEKVVDATALLTSKLVRNPLTGGKIIQGRTRHPSSRAADEWRVRESARLKKALKAVGHGKHIFAYNNVRTNQVVYSLTRTLDQNNVLSQLVFHGKKTVPAKLRKDMWAPYFSVHLPSSAAGHDAFRLLREFSLRRQLEPPKEMITVTEDLVARRRPKSITEAKEYDDNWNRQIGFIMNQDLRARALMDQKATSVADIAQVLEIVRHKIFGTAKTEPEPEAESGETTTAAADSGNNGETKKLSNRAKKRIRLEKLRQEKLEIAAQERLHELERQLSRHREMFKIAESTDQTQHLNVPTGEARIFWVDPKDAEYAPAWPDFTVHGMLNRADEHVMDYHLGQTEQLLGETTQASPAQ